jgi:1,4-alpha-glucan branching enzyme
MHDGEHIKADLLLVFHAHLPYIRIPLKRFPMQEIWLFQILTESYVPLILKLMELLESGYRFNVTFSLSPTLMSMLDDDYYKMKYRDYLRVVLRLVEKLSRSKNPDIFRAVYYLRMRIEEVLQFYERINGDLIGEFKLLSERGVVNLITTCATHALLPAFRFDEDLVRLQVTTGLEEFHSRFGFTPRGLWLPEMGYFAGLDRILVDIGIEYTFLDAAGIYLSREIPERGSFSPLISDAGLFIFARDMILSNIIWSGKVGYPGDFHYREFHHDYTYSLNDEDLEDSGIERLPFGLKLYRVTGKDGTKDYYDPDMALKRACEHSDDFIDRILRRAREVHGIIHCTPFFTLPFDAELFGHWWYEGPDFLDQVLRGISLSDELQLLSPEDLINMGSGRRIRPAESSWGKGGVFETWLNPECLWIYPKIAELYKRIRGIALLGEHESAIIQAMREILLAQSSDWTFLIDKESSDEYARNRLREHLDGAERIIGSIESGNVDRRFVEEREISYPLFKTLRYKSG